MVYDWILLYFSSSLFNNLKNRFWRRIHPNSWFWTSLKLSNCTRVETFYMSQISLKNFSTTLHTHFSYLTKPVCPFKHQFRYIRTELSVFVVCSVSLWIGLLLSPWRVAWHSAYVHLSFKNIDFDQMLNSNIFLN